jgi:short-subunit dehydrogenase
MNSTVLISGANRGIGLEFVKQYASKQWRVIACCREPATATELHKLQAQHATISIHQLDVTEQTQINALAQELKDIPIDLLINNAGSAGEHGVVLGNLHYDNMQTLFKINAFAPLKIAEAFINSIAQSRLKQIVLISSRMGSIADNTSGHSYAYRATKTAANMLMKSLAVDVAAQGIKVLMLHPGWVKTRMGGNDALLTVEESVKGMINVICTIGMHKTGVFYSYNGEEIPW